MADLETQATSDGITVPFTFNQCCGVLALTGDTGTAGPLTVWAPAGVRAVTSPTVNRDRSGLPAGPLGRMQSRVIS